MTLLLCLWTPTLLRGALYNKMRASTEFGQTALLQPCEQSNNQPHQKDHVRPRVLPELLQVLPLLQAEHEVHEPCGAAARAVRLYHSQSSQGCVIRSSMPAARAATT